MRIATLYIAEAGGAPFATIEDALILEGVITRAHAQRDDVLEQEAVEVAFTAADLGGAALPHLLPEGRLRATLVLDAETIIDGATQRELIACSSAVGGERDWTVRVQNEARRELDERLEALDLSAIKGSAGAIVLSTLVGETAMSLAWYSVAAMAEAALAYVATVVGTLPVFRGGIRYLDAGNAPATFFPPDGVYVATAPDPENDDTTYPKGTAKAFLDALIESHGWTLRVAYAPFPSSGLVVEVVDGRWIEATPVLTLDALAEDDWDVSVQSAEKEDFALSMEVGETDPAYGYLSDLGSYAARTWRRDGEGEPTNRSTQALPYVLPSYEWDDITTETVAYDADYSETQRRARPVLDVDAIDAWHLVVARSGKGIFERRPATPASGFVTQLETWPASLYPAHALSAYSRVEVRGQFDVADVVLPAVGSADRVEVDGLSLAVVEASVNEDTRSATVTLARPVPEYDAVAAFPPAFAPINLEGEILPVIGVEDEYFMRVTWLPDARTMLPIAYEAERDGETGWEALTVYGDARIPYAEISDIDAFGAQIVRVRSVYVTGAVSEWLTEVLP